MQYHRRSTVPRSLTLVFALALMCLRPVSSGAEPEPYRGKVFLGIGGDTVPLAADARYGSRYGMRLTRVAAGSSGEKAGLELGDIVVSVDGSVWTDERIQLSRSFGKAGSKAQPGQVATVVLLRSGPGIPAAPPQLVSVAVELTPYPRTAPERPYTPTNAELRPDLVGVRSPAQDLCWQLIRATGIESECLDLLARIERCEQFPDPDRLAMVRYVHRAPFKLETIAREVIDAVAGIADYGERTTGDLFALAEFALTGFGASASGVVSVPALSVPAASYAGAHLGAHLDYIERVLEVAAGLHQRAFAALSADEVAFILEHRDAMVESFVRFKMLSYDTDQKRQTATLRLLDLAGKVDVAALLAQARVVSVLVAPVFVQSLREAAAASGASMDAAVIARRDTAYGQILVAGRGRTRYSRGSFAALYELGGDDVYANNQAASIWGGVPSAVLVDYAGDDAYETYEHFRQGCGALGVGILADLAGDDCYVGTSFTQGAGFLGVGLLLDVTGNDVYRGLQLHQGIGHWGAGILLDLSGTDRYEAELASQGVGLPGGFGLVLDAGREGDSYYCKGKQSSGYGTPGVFEGWGQGIGIGYRPYASGGVGVLCDRSGPDRMEAGNFAQGGGYYYGFGILHNDGDDADHYIGSRYAQGFGCHQAAGAFIEAGGDDRYSTRYAVAQGLAWDEAVALFLEEAGDDTYEGGSFSQGASAMNGWTSFLDLGGCDTYLFTDQARAGGNDYHGGTSLSFFVDAGGDEDKYPKRPNNRIEQSGEKSIFADLPGGIAEAASKAAISALLVRPRSD